MLHIGGFLLLSSFFFVIEANVIGIDFGSDNFKVAIVQPGDPLQIDATALMARKPEVTFTRLMRMLGRVPEHPSSMSELKAHYFPYEVYTNSTWGGTCIKHEDTYYTPEELIAMLLQHAKDMTKNYGGKVIKDCVITVPSSFTQRERIAMYAAADIAELKVLTLIEENTAAALHFGIDRVFEQPHTVLFYNMGASEVQVSVVTYSAFVVKEGGKNKTVGQFEVVGKGWDSGLGSFTFDVRLAELLADRFNDAWSKKASGKGKDVRDFLRPMTRLRGEATKIREVLSANNEYPVKAEQLHADTDLITKVTRADLEKACEDLYPRFVQPVDAALKMANLTLADVHAVEMLGGGVRMPRVKKLLEDYFRAVNLELGQHLNGDEAMALGAAFRAANLSTAFRVRKVGVTDTSSFGVSVRLETLAKAPGFFDGMLGLLKDRKEEAAAEAWTKHASLYPRMSAVPSKTKTVAFAYDQDILCKLEYDDDVALPSGTSPLLAVYNITGIADFAKESAAKGLGQPKVQLSFALDSSGIVTLTKAEVTVEMPLTEEPEEKPEGAANTTASAEVGETAETNATEGAAPEASAEAEPSNSTDASTDGVKKAGKKDSKKDKKAKDKKAKKDAVLRRTLVVEENHPLISPATWSPALLGAARSRLRALNDADAARKAIEAAMNELEGYLYKVKNRLSDDEKELSQVSTEEQRTEVLELTQSTLDWLDEEGGSGQEVSTYKTKLSAVKRKAEAIFYRFSELTDRPAAVAKARKMLLDVRLKAGEWTTKLPHITEEEKSKLMDLVSKAEAWLDDKTAQQSATAATAEPVFASEDVPAQLKLVGGMFEKLLRKPKPAPEKPAANATASNSTDSTKSQGASGNGTEKVEVKVDPEAKAKPEADAKTGAEGGEAKTEAKAAGDEL